MRLKLTTSSGAILAEHTQANAIQVRLAVRNPSENTFIVTITADGQCLPISTGGVAEVFKWLQATHPALAIYEVKHNVQYQINENVQA